MLQNKLKELREKNGLSQEDVANELRVTRQAVSRWENGRTQPDLGTVKKMAKLYNVSLDELMEMEEKTVSAEKSTTESEFIIPILYLLCLAISAFIPPLGLVIALFTLIKYNHKYKLFIKIASIACLLFCLYNVGITIHYYTYTGTGTVEKID